MRRREAFRSGLPPHARKNAPVFLRILAQPAFRVLFSIILISDLCLLTSAHAQTYYYTGKNPMTPMANDAASAIPCDDQAIGTIRYNTGTAAFEGCNGVAWADIRNGATAGAAGLTGQVQFNSGGALAASANFFWDNVNGRLGVGTTTPGDLLDVVGSGGSGQTLARFSSAASSGNTVLNGGVSTNNLNLIIQDQGTGGSSFEIQYKAGPNISYGRTLEFGNSLAMEGGSNSVMIGSYSTGIFASTTPGPTNGLAVSGNVGIGTAVPYNSLSVGTGTVQYTGTATQSGTTITGSGTTFTPAMVGSRIVFANGPTENITGYTNATTLTASVSQPEAGSAFTIYYPGFDVTSAGNVGIGNTSPGALLDIGNASTTLGTLRLENGASAFYTQFQPSPSATASATYTLPPALPASNKVLQSDSSGNLSWTANGAAATAAGSTGQVQFNSGGALAASANFTWNIATGTLKATNYDTNAASGTYKLGGTTVLNLPDADTTSIAVGNAALAAQSATSLDNVALGSNAGQYISTGSANVALGYDAMMGISGTPLTGTGNTGVGNSALLNLKGATSGNTAVGYEAGQYIELSAGNTALGYQAMLSTSANPLTTFGAGNTAVGYQTLYSVQRSTSQNTAVGYQALYSLAGNGSNTAVGYKALYSAIGPGTPDEAFGENAGFYITSGSGNTALGYDAMVGNGDITGDFNVALGFQALSNIFGAASYNTAVGVEALLNTTTGPNSALGYQAGFSITTGQYNTALGTNTMGANNLLTGNDNTAVGDSALFSLGGAASSETAVGSSALLSDTGGANNTGVGTEALWSNLTGTDNVAVGAAALIAGTGTGNTALGSSALFSSTADYNTALGYAALESNITGTDNVAIGPNALDASTGTGNTAVGSDALYFSSAGNYNTVLGYSVASTTLGTGSNNILIGTDASTDTTSSGSSNTLNIGNAIYGTNLQNQTNTGGSAAVGINQPAPGTALDVNGGVTVEPTSVTLTANNTVLATANRSYFQVTSDNATETNRVFCFGSGTLGQIIIIEWTSSTNRGEIVSHGNCSGAAGAVTASLSFTNWAPKNTETILQLMYNGTHWIQIAGSANY